MSKKLTILLSIFMVSVLAISCSKKDAKKNETKDTKKVTKKVDTKKAAAKKATTKSSVNELDFSYFPEATVVVGSVDINKFLSIKVLQPLMKEALAEANKMGIEVEKAKFASYYLNVDSLQKLDDAAVLVNGLTITEAVLTKLGAKFKKETYNKVELLLEPGGEMAIAGLKNDTLAGSVKSIKKMLNIKSGKGKSLATAKTAEAFKTILAKTGKSAFKIGFVPNALVKAEFAKLSKKEELAMAADLVNNFKAASFGIEVTDKAFNFSINIQSSEDAIKAVHAMGSAQLAMLKQANSPMLKMVEPMLGKRGTEILSEVVKTIEIKADKEFLSVTLSTKLEYWLEAQKIFGAAMGKMR